MKYLCGIKGQLKIKCEKQDGTQKSYKCTEDVKNYAKNNLKRDDPISCEFDPNDYTINSIKKYVKKAYNNKGKFEKGGYTPKDTNAINRQSAVKSASHAIAGVGGVTLKDYKKIYEELINIGFKFIDTKVNVKSAEVEEKEDTEEELPEQEEDGEEDD